MEVYIVMHEGKRGTNMRQRQEEIEEKERKIKAKAEEGVYEGEEGKHITESNVRGYKGGEHKIERGN